MAEIRCGLHDQLETVLLCCRECAVLNLKEYAELLKHAVEERNRLREALRMVEENAVSFARSAAEASDPWMVGQIRQFFLDPARTALKKGE